MHADEGKTDAKAAETRAVTIKRMATVNNVQVIVVEEGKELPKLDMKGAAFMIINMYCGFGIITIPNGTATGGYIGVVLLPVMALLGSLTALQICKGFAAAGVDNYRALGEAACGVYMG